jgi:hypothetical protein
MGNDNKCGAAAKIKQQWHHCGGFSLSHSFLVVLVGAD